MKIYGDTRINGRYGKFLNALFISTALFLIVWNVRIWTRPVSIPSAAPGGGTKRDGVATERKNPKIKAYNVVIYRDVFNASRKKYVAPRKPKPRKRVVRKTVPVRIPRLTLLGTVILDNGRAAMISFQGRENEAKFYRVGDKIEGFTIKRIDENSVLLTSGKRTLKVVMNSSEKRPAGRGVTRPTRGPGPFRFRGGTGLR